MNNPEGPQFKKAPRAHYASKHEQMEAMGLLRNSEETQTEVVENTEENIQEPTNFEGDSDAVQQEERYEERYEEAHNEEELLNNDNEEATLEEEAYEEPEFLDINPLKTKMVKVKVDGKEEEVTLEEALKGYSRTQHLTKKSQELSQERKKIEDELNRVQQTEAQMSQYYKLALDLAQSSNPVLAEAQKIDWAKLEKEDPNKWMLMQQKVANERQKIQALHEEQARIAAKQFEQLRNQNFEILVNQLVPEWQDTEKFEKEKSELAQYLLKTGFNEQEVNLVVDARQVSLARKAMLYDRMIKAQKTVQAKKTPPQAPKTARPGSGQKTGPDPRATQLREAIKGERNLRKRAELITQLKKLQGAS